MEWIYPMVSQAQDSIIPSINGDNLHEMISSLAFLVGFLLVLMMTHGAKISCYLSRLLSSWCKIWGKKFGF